MIFESRASKSCQIFEKQSYNASEGHKGPDRQTPAQFSQTVKLFVSYWPSVML